MRGRAVVVAVLMILAAAPARGSTMPVVAHASGLPSGWAAFAVTTDGSPHAFEAGTTGLTGPAQIGVAVYSSADRALRQIVFTAFPNRDGTLVRLEPAQTWLDAEVMRTEAGGIRLQVTFNPEGQAPFRGTHKVLLWWAGEARWDRTVRAAPGSAIVASTAGDRAWLLTSRDLRGGAHAQAYVASAGGRAGAGGAATISVERTLIGYYQSGVRSVHALWVEGPEGTRSCAPAPAGAGRVACDMFEASGPQRAGPGTYTFRATGAGAGDAGPSDEVWFGGADAVLPALS